MTHQTDDEAFMQALQFQQDEDDFREVAESLFDEWEDASSIGGYVKPEPTSSTLPDQHPVSPSPPSPSPPSPSSSSSVDPPASPAAISVDPPPILQPPPIHHASTAPPPKSAPAMPQCGFDPLLILDPWRDHVLPRLSSWDKAQLYFVSRRWRRVMWLCRERVDLSASLVSTAKTVNDAYLASLCTADWLSVDSLAFGSSSVTDRGLLAFLSRFRRVSSLSLSRCQALSPLSVAFATHRFARCLRVLKLDALPHLPPQLMLKIAKRCRLLESLSLNFVNLSPEAVHCLITFPPSLTLPIESLSSSTTTSTTSTTSSLANRLLKLGLSGANFGAEDAGALRELGKHLVSLRRVKLVNATSVDSFLANLAEASGASLERVDASSSDISTASLRLLAAHCPCLSRLRLFLAKRLSFDAWRSVAAMPGLRFLDAKQAGSSADLTLPFAGLLPALGASLRTLVVHLASDQMLAAVAQGLPLLRDLRCDASRLAQPDAALLALLRGCPALRRLDLVRSSLSGAAVRQLPAMRPLPRLRQLALSGSAGLQDEDVGALLGAFPQLQELGLDICRQLTDAAAQRVAFASPQELRVLNVNLNKAMTAAALFALLDACPRLVKLLCGSLAGIDAHRIELRAVAGLRIPKCYVEC